MVPGGDEKTIAYGYLIWCQCSNELREVDPMFGRLVALFEVFLEVEL